MTDMTTESSRPQTLRAVKGMNDILPHDSHRWEWFEATVRAVMHRYGYLNIRTPILEPTALFVRGLGEVTDIVEKEMYSFVDALNDDHLSLRPENTAGVVRATIEHNLLYDGGKRLFYIGPMFRHERPQRGRYRQFHQVGVEALGFPGADLDAEVILMARAIWQALGLPALRLELNCLGQTAERNQHRQALIEYLQAHRQSLDSEAQQRLQTNPLRILDSKNPQMRELLEAAPRLIDYLGTASRQHLEAVCACLQAAGQEVVINPRLVRGLDYYNLTVFEWVTDELGAQGTLCGGGRYDPLIGLLGGKPAPAVGWGMGVERVLELCAIHGLGDAASPVDVYCVVPHAQAVPQAIQVAEVLRQCGLSVVVHPQSADGSPSMKSQFKRADASGARFALIFGQEEMERGQVSVKPLRDASAEQTRRPLDSPAQWAQSLRTA